MLDKKFMTLLGLVLLGACTKKQQTIRMVKNTVLQHQTSSKPLVTVFIHGTVLVPKGVFANFFYSIPGIHHYSEYGCQYRLRKIADRLIANPTHFPGEHFYILGWNGALSFDERLNAARMLDSEFKRLIVDYQTKYGTKPDIRLITHSHGGNVALNLCAMKPSYVIKQLILLACPVQDQTKYYCTHPCFESIYSLYSVADIIQVLDPQGIQQRSKEHIFSERLFPAAQHIKQAKIKIDGRSILHIEFLLDSFISFLPQIIDHLNVDSANNLVLSCWSDSKKIK